MNLDDILILRNAADTAGLSHEFGELIYELAALRAELEEAQKKIAELEQIILWALGDGDEFPMPPETVKGRPKFWWRSELRRRYEALAAKGDV